MMELREDHARFSRVLLLISRESMQLGCSQTSNLALFTQAVDYIVNIQNQEHHPREELMFDLLAEKSPLLKRRIEHLNLEHRKLGRAGKKMLRQLRNIKKVRNANIPIKSFQKSIARFVEDMRQHIRAEEEIMYSEAAFMLSESDWTAISANPVAEDPLKRDVGGRFALLTQALNSTPDPVTLNTQHLGWYGRNAEQLYQGFELTVSHLGDFISLSQNTIRALPKIPALHPWETWKTVSQRSKEFCKFQHRCLNDWRDWRYDSEWRIR